MSLIERALVSGTVAAAAVTLVVSFAGRRAAGSSAAPLNATSHFLWGERAARQDGYSVRYTATGFAANYGASVFWALCYEALAGRMPLAAAYAALALGLSARDLVR